ncbi:MAG: PEP-CTERM sorting domain-containing protein, partial [Verrucomicrobia bacterium]|nr:PEP-CTERM sorting domain-containing protein [Verrucomicrobiota bacterium]
GNVIVGFSAGTGLGANGRAVSWTGGSTTPAILGTLPGVTTPNSAALGVSHNGGVIVGWSDTTNGVLTEAFKWTSGTNMSGLGDLPGGLFFSQANGVSGDGTKIVGFGNNATTNQEAFQWTTGGGMTGLGISGDADSSVANAANGDGSVIVGTEGLTNGSSAAFLWTSALGLQRLQDVLTTIGVTNLAGWQLQEALAVSSDGFTIAGVGLNPNGGREAWVATVPEPSTVGLAMVGACALGYSVIRRRNRR